MTDPAKIAEGLTEAGRALMLRLPREGGYARRGYGMAAKGLQRRGLLEPSPRYAFIHVFTPLGLQVRDILQREKPNG